nr:hypothetical protein GCM10020241_10120 [Streptoalloteichus tenebrarius]
MPGGSGPVPLAVPLLLIGSGFGISLAILDGAAISSVDSARAGMAAGLFNTVRITGEVVALAVLGALITTLTRTDLAARYGEPVAASATSRLLQGDMVGAVPAGVAPAAFAESATAAYAGALHVALWILSALSLLGAVVVGRLTATRREDGDTKPRLRARPARAI